MRFRLASALAASLLIVTLAAARPFQAQRAAPPALPLELAWQTPLEAAPVAWPAYYADHAFVAIEGGDGGPSKIAAVSLADGTVRWRRDVADILLLGAGDGLVFVATSRSVHALSAATGDPSWEVALDSPPTLPLTVARGWLLITTKANVIAVRTREGSRVWTHATPVTVAAAPAISGNALYLPLADNRIVRLALETATIVWRAMLAAPPSSLLALDDRVFAGTKGRLFYAIDPRNGHVRWKVRVGMDVVGVPVVDENRVYFLSLDNLLRALDRRSGILQAREILTRRALFGPFRAGNLLLVSGMTPTIEGFTLPGLKPAGAYEAGGTDTGGVKFAGPIHVVPGSAAGAYLIVGVTGEGEVLALRPNEKKEKGI